MKRSFFAITIMLTSLTGYVMADSGGMSSSGGGEVTIENNPWFMGNKPVVWCVSHGGADKFSLDKDLAVQEIKEAINVLTSQLKSINRRTATSKFGDDDVKTKCGAIRDEQDRKIWLEFCDYRESSTGVFQVSDNYEYSENCNEADLEFILGNYEDVRVKELRTKLGNKDFDKYIGYAYLSTYSRSTLRGKGFIYVAADRGNIQYSGRRNQKFGDKDQSFWDNHTKIDKATAIPDGLKGTHEILKPDMFPKAKLSDYSMGLLTSVAAHEFGHVLGLVHGSGANIMHLDYLSALVRDGVAFRSNFQKDSMVLSGALIEQDTNTRIGYDWSDEYANNEYKKEQLMLNSPNIYDLVSSPKQEAGFAKNRFLYFDFSEDINGEHFIKIGHQLINTMNYEYKGRAYSIELRKEGCGKEIEKNFVTLGFDKKYERQKNITLLRLGSKSYCGKIFINEEKDKYIEMKLSHDYFLNTSQLELMEPRSNEKFIMPLLPRSIGQENMDELKIVSPLFQFRY